MRIMDAAFRNDRKLKLSGLCQRKEGIPIGIPAGKAIIVDFIGLLKLCPEAGAH